MHRSSQRVSLSTLALSGGLVLFGALLAGCGGASAKEIEGAPAASGSDGGTPSTDDAASSTPVEGWRYGDEKDEAAYCELFARAEATSNCAVVPDVETRLLASCASSTECYRTIFRPDFLQRQRSCLEAKMNCSQGTDACSDVAAATYADGASVVATCTKRKQSCRDSGAKFNVACESLAALVPEAQTKARKCLESAIACPTLGECMNEAFGGACAKPKP